MTTLAQAITHVRARLGEVTSAAWENTEIRSWVNEGVRDIARRTESLQVDAPIPTTANESKYPVPANALRVYHASYSETGSGRSYPLEYQDFNAMDSIWYGQMASTTARPRMFTLWGYPPTLELILYPVPNVAGSITLRYYALPEALATDGSEDALELDIIPGYEDLVYDYATYLALRRDRDPRWQEHKLSYEENMVEMMDATRRWSDQASTISRTGNPLPDWLVGGGYY